MVRPRSTQICPKCNKPGYESLQWTRRNYNVYSPETSFYECKPNHQTNLKFSEGENGLYSKSDKKYSVQSKKYIRGYFIHHDTSTGKRKKCYIKDLEKNSKPGSILKYSFLSLSNTVDHFARIIRLYPPSIEDDRMLTNWFNEFFVDPSKWIAEVSKECAKNGLDMNDSEFKEKLKLLPQERQFDIMLCNPLWRAVNYHYFKYVVPSMDQQHNLIKKKLRQGFL